MTRKHGHAVLKGSPKALGWTIDEEEEMNAWVMLMGDALEGSVYESSNHPDEEVGPWTLCARGYKSNVQVGHDLI